MYLNFFGLHEAPFTITPDPRYLYLSSRHTDALAHLLYGVSESGGFVQLTGEVGTGKTMLVRSLLEQLPEHADVALILNPQLSPYEFLQAICDELGIRPVNGNGAKDLVDCLNAYLLHAHATGRRTVVIVDEAQNLAVEVLEQVRLLTNLETSRQKLLQIILIGQPELKTLLAGDNLRQLAQRITGRYHLEPLSHAETAHYLSHRMRVAGAVGNPFQPAAIREIYRRSRGIPRLINVLADRALLGAYTREQPQITGRLVRQAAREVFGVAVRRRRLLWGSAAAATAAAALVALMLWNPLPISLFPSTLATQTAGPAMESATEPAATGGETAAAQDDAAAAPEALPIAQLFALPLDTGTDAALATLFGLWLADYAQNGASTCDQAREQGLVCMFQRGSWEDLLTHDLPVILPLADTAGRQHQFVLAQTDGTLARLDTAGQSFWIATAELSDHWPGEYLLLWRPHDAEVGTLVPGMRHEAVIWLRESLAALTGEALASTDAAFFDPVLEDGVRRFQQSHGLEADGLVGPRTRIVLQNELGGAGIPRLSRGSP